MKTITYDPAVCKLVPVVPAPETEDYICDCCTQDMVVKHPDWRSGYRAMLAAVPADLPGVVEHSGEPIGYTCQEDILQIDDSGFIPEICKNDHSEVGLNIPLYTHAEPAEVAALRERVAQLEAEYVSYEDDACRLLDTIRDLEAQLAAQSAWQERVQKYKLDDYIRHTVNRAIEDAVHPKGMSLCTGKATIDASVLKRLLLIAEQCG